MRKFNRWFLGVSGFLVLMGISKLALAADAVAPVINTGDTAWVLLSAALVFLMTPGLAFFYGGLVRKKNMLSVLMQCFMLMCIITLQWVIFGYSLSFGPDIKGMIGSLSWAGLHGVGLEPFADYSATVPHQAFMIYQAMFAIITPGLILGAFAERMKFSAFVVFSLLWATFVYDPVCHWVWGVGGFLRNMGALDFAGGTVVHINAGVAALACALVLGKRKGYPSHMSPPHNLPFAVLGAGLLWFGWFGFNAGSALVAGELSTLAFFTTHVATATAALSWMVAEWKIQGKPTTLGAASGALAGLVAITPAAGFVGPLPAMFIGLVAGTLCYLAVLAKGKFGYDDALDVVGVHGVGGIWGALATGLFASTVWNPAGKNGLFFGNPGQLGVQAIGVVAAVAYSMLITYIILKVIDAMVGLRVTEDEERQGLDLTQHSETGYSM